jgi:hypothetical protein
VEDEGSEILRFLVRAETVFAMRTHGRRPNKTS